MNDANSTKRLNVRGIPHDLYDKFDQLAKEQLATKSMSKAIVHIMRLWVDQGGSFKEISPSEYMIEKDQFFNKKSRRISVTLSEKDRVLLDILSLKRHTSVAFFVRVLIREAIYNRRFLIGDELEELRKSNFELSRVGVNLNQMVRRFNAGHFVGMEQDFIEIKRYLKAINNHVDKAKKLLREQVN